MNSQCSKITNELLINYWESKDQKLNASQGAFSYITCLIIIEQMSRIMRLSVLIKASAHTYASSLITYLYNNSQKKLIP